MTNFTVDGLDHVHVAVRDRKAAAEWYARVLGLVPAPERAAWAENPEGPLFLATPVGAHCLALFAREPQAGGDHTIAFRAGGAAFARFCDRLAGLGLVDRSGAPVGPGDIVDHKGALSFYFCDPDGNRIELTTYDPVAGFRGGRRVKDSMADAGQGLAPDEARAAFADELAAFRTAHPEIAAAEVFVIDLNGTARGKLVPIETLGKLAKGTMKMPASTPGLDIFGHDVEEAGIAIQTGDPDGALDPVPGSLGPVLWAGSPTAQVQATIRMPDGRLSGFDPRGVLARVAAEAAARGLTPCIALELEFFLLDPREPRPPMHPDCGGRLTANQVYDLDLLREFEPVVSRIAGAARALGAPAETVIAEFGTGQFEINLVHTADALAAADQMVALKRAIRGTARAAGMDATFMAKPYGDKVGSGLHLHLSLQDGQGRNVFDSAPGAPNPRMRHAIAGMLRHMADCQLIFAPHLNSYRRMVPGSFVPVEAHWAFDNRGSALRLPDTCGAGARIEHRVAGSDANPYLVTAAILAAVLAGIDQAAEPPPPVDGQIMPGRGEPLPLSWASAERRFARSDFVARWLGEQFRHVYGAQKRQEREHMLRLVTDREYEVYLRRL